MGIMFGHVKSGVDKTLMFRRRLIRKLCIPLCQISEESENTHTAREIWRAAIATFMSKLLFAITFVIPFLFLPLPAAVIASLVWGFSVLSVMSYVMACKQREPPLEGSG